MHRFGFVLTALILASPLFDAPGGGYDALRLPVVLGLTALLLGVAFVKAARGGERPAGQAPLRTAGLLLLGTQLLSLITARSLAEAVAPILILFAGVSVYSCLRGGIVRRESVPALATAISGVGLIFALIGIVQQLVGMQAVSTEGNRNYAGTLAAMIAPVALSQVWSGPTWRRILSGGSAIALTVLLGLSESRGGGLAFLAGCLIVLGTVGKQRLARREIVAVVALVLVAGLAALFLPSHPLSKERMETAGLRLNIWKSGLRMFTARPLLGGGAGSFSAEYPPYRSEAEFRASHQAPGEGFREVEDAHSSWVQTAADTGAPGLLALLLVAYIAARLWRYYVAKSDDPERTALIAGLGAGAAAYLIAGGFNALTLKISHSVLFWAFLGLMELVGDARPWRSAARSREWKVALPAAAAFLAIFGAGWEGAVGLARRSFTEAMQTERPDLREATLREALDLNPWFWQARYELARTLSAVQRYRGAADEGKAVLKLRPHHVEALNQAAVCLLQAQGDEKEAEAWLRHAIDVAPFYFKSYFNLALLEGRRGRGAGALQLFTHSIVHNGRHASSYYCRGALLAAGGEATAALEDFRQARALGFDVASALRAEQPAAAADARYAELFR